jgi:TetR/AcrR family transcriptional regulator of autoinduction and epiphytic fitness
MLQEGRGEQVDGRTARALRTREAIVDATIALVEEGDVRPTAPRIADRAEVSVRSVFQHFDDLESLYAAVAERLFERVAGLVSTIDRTMALPARIERFVAQRGRLLEAISPIRRAANVHAPFSAEITQRLRSGHEFFKAEVEQAFAPELDRLDEPERGELLDALSVTLSWGSWETLRTLDGSAQARARRILERAVAAVLASAPALR